MRFLILFALGAVIGSLLDGIHTHTGMTEYSNPWIWKMSVVTPFVFGGAAVAITLVRDQLVKHWPWPKTRPAVVAAAFAWFVGAYFASGYVTVAKLAVVSAMGVAAWALFARNTAALVLALMAAVLGPLAEVGITSAGIFHHNEQDLLGVPLWLCGLYMCGAICVATLSEELR